jgi:hypothetical protein
MLSKQLDLFNKRVKILHRFLVGDTITGIAASYDVSRYVITRHIKKAKQNSRIVKAAEDLNKFKGYTR